MYVFCLSCPRATFAFQRGGFVRREELAAKSLYSRYRMRKIASNSFPGLLVNNKQRKRREGQSVSLTENVCSASVKSNCAVPPPSRANSWALASLFSLDGKFPVARTFEMSNAPRWGRKRGQMRLPQSTL